MMLSRMPHCKCGTTDFDILIEGDLTFWGRRKSIQFLFYELIANALQFKKVGIKAQIKIRTFVIEENLFPQTVDEYNYSDHIRIEFCDNGIGFEAEYATYIFGLFNKLDKNSQGVGLGLSLCEQIVSRLHGRITASSQVGHGASFVVVLPINPAFE